MPAAKKEESQNVRFYSKFMATPKEAQKSFSNGSFSGTDINPMWRIQILTEVFGPVGFGWWTQNVRYDFVEAEQTNEVSVFCELELVVKDPATGEISHPIYGIGGNTYVKQWGTKGARTSDEAKKMAYTDAMSIACKALGIGHDIWYGNDRTKYTMYETDAPVKEPKKAETKAETKPETKPELKPEPKAEHTEDTATLIAQIDDKIRAMTKDMSKEDKLKLATETIKPILGMSNYKICTDVDKLTKLRDKLLAA